MNWLINNWAKFGGLCGLVILGVLYLSDWHYFDIRFIIWVHFVALLFHQFEEYVFPGGFKMFYNESIWNKNPITTSPLTNKGILMVNIIVAWTAYGLAAIISERTLSLTIGLAMVTLVNGLLHTMMFVLLRKYNPGFYTGLFICIPLGLYILFRFYNEVPRSHYSAGIGVFVIGLVLVPLFIKLTSFIKQ